LHVFAWQLQFSLAILHALPARTSGPSYPMKMFKFSAVMAKKVSEFSHKKAVWPSMQFFFFNQACLKVKWPAENLPTSSSELGVG